MLRWWEGWVGVGHVNVMFMVRWCYVDGRGGLGWGMLTSCSWYVDATLMGGVGWGHVNVMFMVRWCYIDGRGGVGWGMLTSCLISVTNNSIEHRNLLAVHHINKKPGLHTVLTALKKIRELSMSSLQPASKVWDRAPWTLWKRTCCSMCKRMLTLKLQHVPFHANIQKIANTYKKTLPSYYTTSRSKNWQFSA